MSAVAIIRMDFLTWWLGGTGAGLGAGADVRAHRSADGWPSLPMTQVKGTLAETAADLVSSGALDADVVEAIFAGRGAGAGVAFDDEARVPKRLRPEGAEPAGFYVRIPSTAVDDLGAASDFTLRAIEAVRPIRLEGVVRAGDDAPEGWVDALDTICAATMALGKLKANYGDVVMRCLTAREAATSKERDAAPSGGAGAKAGVEQVLDILLRPRAESSFAARPATEGVQRSLAAPTGASLLGWCARRYADFDNPTGIFHSGEVRFGSAHPDAGAGVEVMPIPKTLAMPKARKGDMARNRIDPDIVRQGRPSTDEEEDEVKGVQYQAVGDGYMTPDLRRLSVERGQRVRTATENRRAREGGLFTAQHIAPERFARQGGQASRVGTVFRASITFQSTVSRKDRETIATALGTGELRLGGDRRSGKGGLFDVELTWRDRDEAQIRDFGTNTLVPVLCLSDVAPTDDIGAPAMTIHPECLGLGKSARFRRDRSVLSHRRYAPWNGLFDTRIEERLVIEAGSVLVYELSEPASAVQLRNTVGLYRSEGLGCVAIAPPLLDGFRIEPAPGIAEIMTESPDVAVPMPDDSDGDDEWFRRIASITQPEEPIDA